MKASSSIKKHQQYTRADYEYLKTKGYSNQEIISLWDRELASGKEPVTLNKYKIDWKAKNEAEGLIW